jgi:hypothetical protein
MCIVDFLKGYDVPTHHNTVEKTLSHEILEFVWCFCTCKTHVETWEKIN